MTSNYKQPDPVFGTSDLDDFYITNNWLVDQYVGSRLIGWGINSQGQLAQNSIASTYYSSPVQVGALTICLF